MAGNDKIPRLTNGISISEFRNILSYCVYTETEKEHILSIFNELSSENGVLSSEEWNMFVNRIDTNGDKSLSKYELNRAYPASKLTIASSEKGLYLSREDVINFYKLISKYIKEHGGEIPPAVTSELEYCKNRFNITDIRSTELFTSVKFNNDDGGFYIVEYDNKSGTELKEIMVNEEGYIETIVVYCGYGEVEIDDTPEKFNNHDVFERENKRSGEIMVFSSRLNKHRAGHADDDFAGHWLFSDRAQSKTFDEFLENLKLDEVQYDEEVGKKLAKTAGNIYSRRVYKGNCARHVFDTLTKVKNYMGERMSDGLECKDAYQNAYQLSVSENFREVPYNIVSEMNLNKLPAGCVVVYDGFYKYSPSKSNPVKKYHEFGHVSITKGDNFAFGGGAFPIYDNLITGRQKTHIRVFVPVKLYEPPIKPQTAIETQVNYHVKHVNTEEEQNYYEDE